VLLDFLNELGLDSYEEYEERPQLERAPAMYFLNDEPTMALKGWPSCSPPQGQVHVDAQGNHKIGKHGIWTEVLAELQTESITHSVDCRLVGVPRLLVRPASPNLTVCCTDVTSGMASIGRWLSGMDKHKGARDQHRRAVRAEEHDIFESFVRASSGTSEGVSNIISTDVMRAAIAFKWRTYGKRRWQWRCAQFATFFVTYNTALGVLSRVTAEDDALHKFGAACLIVAFCFGVQSTLLELLQLIARGLQYFTDVDNVRCSHQAPERTQTAMQAPERTHCHASAGAHLTH
jgi:hypothetical protein